MSNCDRLSDDAAFIDCLLIVPQDRWTPQDMTRLLTIAVRATHVSSPSYVSQPAPEGWKQEALRLVDETGSDTEQRVKHVLRMLIERCGE